MERLGFAAGHIKGPDDLLTSWGQDLLRSPVVTISVGSITRLARPGHPEPHYDYDPETGASYNAVGLKNMGIHAFIRRLEQLYEQCEQENKILKLNLAPIQPGDVEYMLNLLRPFLKRMPNIRIQINAGCPNVTNHAIIALSPDDSAQLLREVKGFTSLVPFEFKLSPETPVPVLQTILRQCHQVGIAYVLNGNTIPTDTPAHIKVSQPKCGKAGEPLREPMLKQTMVASETIEELKSQMGVISLGGLKAGGHLLQAEQMGAVEAEVMTGALEEGPKIFQDMLMERAAA